MHVLAAEHAARASAAVACDAGVFGRQPHGRASSGVYAHAGLGLAGLGLAGLGLAGLGVLGGLESGGDVSPRGSLGVAPDSATGGNA